MYKVITSVNFGIKQTASKLSGLMHNNVLCLMVLRASWNVPLLGFFMSLHSLKD